MREWGRALAMLMIATSASAQGRSDEWLRKPVNGKTFETYRSFFAYDRRPTFDARTIDTNVVDGVFIEHLSFESTPGNRVYGNLYEPVGQRGANVRTVIMLHGGVARGKDNVRVMADFMAKSGWRVFAIDLPYFGERKTELLQTFTEAEKHEKLYNSQSTYLAWVTQVAKDVGRSMDFLVRERGTDSTRIGLIGYSRGGQVGAIVGAVDKRFRAVALLYAGHFDAKETGHHPAACPANYIGRIAPRPLFLLNGTQDADYLRAEQVEPLHRIARNPKRIVWVETGHVFPPEETRPVLAKWLSEHIR